MLEYKVRHERPGASSLTQHTSKSRQANDTELSSDPQGVKNGNEWLTVLLKSLRLPTRALLPPPHSPNPPLSHILSFCDLSFIWDWLHFFFPHSSQLAEKLRPLRVSIGVMSSNCSAFMVPLKLSKVAPQMPVHIQEYIEGEKKPSHGQSDWVKATVNVCAGICGMCR